MLDAFIHNRRRSHAPRHADADRLHKTLLNELDEITRGGMVTDAQRVRLMWDNLPIWFRLRR